MSLITSARRFGLSALVCAIVACLSCPRASHAQSEGDLRRENEALKTQLKETQDELDLLKAQVKAMQEQVATLQAQLAAARSGKPVSATPLVEPPVSIDESKPSASPRALLKAITADYETQFKDEPYTSSSDDRSRTAYMRALRSWTQRMNREHKATIMWHVRVLDMGRRGGTHMARVVAVDPETDTELGKPFDVMLTRPLAERLQSLTAKGDESVVVMKGVLEPMVSVNEDRLERGVFDTPPYIGPMAELEFAVNVQTLVAPEAKPANSNATDGGSKPGASTQPAKSAPPAPPEKP